MTDPFAPTPEDRFSFGLWTVGHRGFDPFGKSTRADISPAEIVRRLGDIGSWGVSLHDDDLIPWDASSSEREQIVADFERAVSDAGMVVSMMTVNLTKEPVFRDGAFTAADPAVRRLALLKTVKAIDDAARLGAPVFVLWGGREGIDSGAARNPIDALSRYSEALDFLCDYVLDQGLDIKFALEAKPNEPRGHIYLPTTGHMLHFIEKLAHPELVGVNPELAHEAMAGLPFHQALGQALWADKLFHVDLNAQFGPRYDQDFRFAAEDLKEAFLTVRMLDCHGYAGPRHFDCRALRTEDDEGVFEVFARGCIRNYKTLAAKVASFERHPTVQAAAREAGSVELAESTPAYSREILADLRAEDFDGVWADRKGRGIERVDQALIEHLLGSLEA